MIIDLLAGFDSLKRPFLGGLVLVDRRALLEYPLGRLSRRRPVAAPSWNREGGLEVFGEALIRHCLLRECHALSNLVTRTELHAFDEADLAPGGGDIIVLRLIAGASSHEVVCDAGEEDEEGESKSMNVKEDKMQLTDCSCYMGLQMHTALL